ncbi:DNA polymerase III subunit chi [Comamonas faecalis]|uniref:DNA polymerase III subunit chi n=1 Tax=Comamonas faecalis TaxID=1387849 RepID=A0ABP7R4S9_9BURK
MTEVVFHFNVPDRRIYACRYARKSLRNGAGLAITGSEADLQWLERTLWEMAPTDFVAHCLDDAPPDVVRASPIVLVRDPSAWGERGQLLNLGQQIPDGFTQYERLVEVVSQGDAEDRTGARQRWRQYQEQGHTITTYDVAPRRDPA